MSGRSRNTSDLARKSTNIKSIKNVKAHKTTQYKSSQKRSRKNMD